MPEEYKLLTIFVDVFEGYFRHLSQVLVDNGVMDEDAFWKLVAGRIIAYQEAHPNAWKSIASTTCSRRR